MSKKKKKKLAEVCTCVPNCIYFQQDVPKEQILAVREENGVLMRTVRRNCLYDNTVIKSWSHLCGRGRPCFIRAEAEAQDDDASI